MGFLVRPAAPDVQPEDRRLIVATIGEYLPELDPELRFRWLYETNPHGRALTWLAIDEESGELAGLTSFFRRRLWVEGRVVEGALGGDGYVRPAFRRRGLGELMHKASRRDMPAHAIQVMFGTPMDANLTPLTKAGARSIAETVRFACPLGGRGLAVAESFLERLTGKSVARATLAPMLERDRRIDEVWESTRGELGIATVRDAAFYDWRFRRSPSQRQSAYVVLDDGRPVAACALERVDDRLRIVDLLAPARHFGLALGAIAKAHEDCATLELKLTREDGEARHLLRHGFVARETKPLNLLLPEGEPRATTFYDPSLWFFTWAESDMDHA